MNNEDESTSQKPAFDPGWNDPPTLSYNSQQNQPGRPRNFLNKRVPFPLSGGSNSSNNSSQPPIVNLPPMNLSMLPSGPLQNTLKPAETQEEISSDSDNLLKEVKDILLKFIDDSTELGVKANDIKKRISTMEDMWSSGKLNNRIQSLMKNLAYALRDNQPTKADDIHRILMVDHVSAVGTWMPGVKQLVHHCIARCELIAIDKGS